MRFCLYSGRTVGPAISSEQNTTTSHVISITPEINPYDESDTSKCFVQQLHDYFKEQLSCGEEDYNKVLDKTLKQEPLNVRCEWNLESVPLSLTVRVRGHILKVLKDVFGSSSEIRVLLCEPKAEFRSPNYNQQGSEWKTLTTEPGDIGTSTTGMKISDGKCEDKNVKSPKTWKPSYLMNPDNQVPQVIFYAKIRIEFSCFTSKNSSAHRRSANLSKKMLEEEIQADVTIIARDGAEVKCHKSFLAAQSPVFTAMFRSDCKESATSKIEMPQMDEVIVKAFLAYLYYGDLTEAEGDSNIAFDLFEAGHKHEVKTLEEHTKHMLLHKLSDWIDVGVALRLFFIYGKMEGCEDLRTKAIQVMTAKYEELVESEDYKQLLATDPQGAKELCKLALGTQY